MKAREGQEHVVRKSKSTEDQIAFALKQNELGTSVDEVCRKMGISEPTFMSGREAQVRKVALRGPIRVGGRWPRTVPD